MDRYMDTTRTSPMYLPEDIAGIVDLRAGVIMANHVHVLWLPEVSPQRLPGGLKACTARQANQVLGHTGRPFWQAESFDH
jgi:hypothetical protein